jgi:O-antigen/teichoic acid export membrane protein
MNKQLLKNSFVYTSSSFAQKGLTFLLLPLYIHYLNAAEFGSVTIVLAFSYVISILFTLGLDSAVVRFYYDKKEAESFKIFFGTILISILTIACINYLLLITLLRPVIQILLDEIPFYPYAFIGFAIAIFQPLYNFSLAFFQAKHEAVKYALASWFYFIVNISLTVLFVIVLEWKGEGYLLAILFAQAIACLVSLFILRKEYTLTFRFNYLKTALGYSSPLIPHSLASQAASYADRFILNKFMNTATVGVYQVGTVLSMPAELLAFNINRAFMPSFFKATDEKAPLDKIIDTSLIIVLLYLTVAALISAFCPEVLSWFFGPAFIPAATVIPLIAFAYVNSGLYYLFSAALFYEKKLTRYVPICTILGGVTTIGLNLALIPVAGIAGAGFALFAGQLVLTTSAFVFSLKSNIIRWPVGKFIAGYLTFAATVGFLTMMSPQWNFWVNLLVKTMALLLAFFLTSQIYWKNGFAVLQKAKTLIKNTSN